MNALRIEPLTPKLWTDFEKLFGAKGACAGCWCMFWRLEEGERFADLQGAKAKARMKKLIADGEAKGLLAFDGEEPVGWVALGGRREFKKLDRAPSLQCDDADQVWSAPCFFIHKDYRGKGVASALLKEAAAFAKKNGAKILEGYPLKPAKGAASIPAAFAFTGTLPLFEKAGFAYEDKRAKGKQRMRKKL